MLNKDHILAGKAIFTIKLGKGKESLKDAKPHYTYKVRYKPATMFSKEVFFVSLLTGPDNTKSYTYMGCLDRETGYVRLTAKSKYQEESAPLVALRKVLYRLWRNELEMVLAAEWDLQHCGFCMKCMKTLTVPESIASGYGPECSKRMGIGRVRCTPVTIETDETEWETV